MRKYEGKGGIPLLRRASHLTIQFGFPSWSSTIFVASSTHQLLALSLVERLVLLRQLLSDDVPDLGLDLLARHLLKRLKVDELDQSLVKLDLELCVLVTLCESAGIADGDEPVLVESALALLLVFDTAEATGFSDLPHGLTLQPKRGSNAGIERVEVLA